MDDRTYILLQRKIFKKYKVECMVVSEIIEFNRMCSRIASYRDCELCYSTVKAIIQEVRDSLKDNKLG